MRFVKLYARSVVCLDRLKSNSGEIKVRNGSDNQKREGIVYHISGIAWLGCHVDCLSKQILTTVLACIEKLAITVLHTRAFLGIAPGTEKTKVRKAYDGKF